MENKTGWKPVLLNENKEKLYQILEDIMGTDKGNNKKFKIQMNVDLNAILHGFETSKNPTKAHRRIMKNFASPLLIGPPESDILLQMMGHMFNDNEAEIAQHLLPLMPLTAKQLSRRTGRSVEDIQPALDNMADNKRVICSFGEPTRYTILPIVPGMFESVIISPDLSHSNHWHKKFSEYFEAVWNTEYMREYIGTSPAFVRYLPTQAVASRLQSAWPTDMLEEMLDPYDVFGIAHCQCRVVTQLVGNGCGKPTENCVGIGPMAQPLIDKGLMRKADKKEILEQKRIAEENGCVTWMMNGRNNKDGNISCSCCGCCCHALRSITQFNMPGLVSAPHFMPKKDDALCNHCGKCVTVCPMGAWKKIGGAMFFETPRCIGCGLCVTSCAKNSLSMKEVEYAKKPDQDFPSLMTKLAPAFVSKTFRVWLRRTAGI